MRECIARFKHGAYTEEIGFMSNHRANSKENKADALHEIWKRKEKGIARNAEVLETYLAE